MQFLFDHLNDGILGFYMIFFGCIGNVVFNQELFDNLSEFFTGNNIR